MQTSLRVQGLLVWPVCGRASSTSLCPPGAHVGSPLVPSPPRHMSRRLGYTSSVSLDVSPSSFPGRGCAPTVDTHRSACTRLSAVALPHLLQGSLLTRSCGPLPGHRAKGVQRGLPEVPPAQLFPSALWPSQAGATEAQTWTLTSPQMGSEKLMGRTMRTSVGNDDVWKLMENF